MSKEYDLVKRARRNDYDAIQELKRIIEPIIMFIVKQYSNIDEKKHLKLQQEAFGNSILKYEKRSLSFSLMFETQYLKLIKIQQNKKDHRKKEIEVEYGNCSRKKLLETISQLNPEYQRVFYLKFGLSLDENNDLSTSDAIIFYRANMRVKKLLKRKKVKERTLFEYLNEYAKEEILHAIQFLSYDQHEIIKKKYGIEYNTVNEITDDEKEYLRSAIKSLKRIMNNSRNGQKYYSTFLNTFQIIPNQKY